MRFQSLYFSLNNYTVKASVLVTNYLVHFLCANLAHLCCLTHLLCQNGTHSVLFFLPVLVNMIVNMTSTRVLKYISPIGVSCAGVHVWARGSEPKCRDDPETRWRLQLINVLAFTILSLENKC